jgi:hypothetical protein
MKKLTAAWIRKAESDFRVAKNLTSMRPPAHDEVCFHSQQAAEKFFKALLQEWGLPVPKIHELDDLLRMLLPRDATLQVVRRGLRGLSRFAVDYPGRGDSSLGVDISADQWKMAVCQTSTITPAAILRPETITRQ